jgi:hypothetical protein
MYTSKQNELADKVNEMITSTGDDGVVRGDVTYEGTTIETQQVYTSGDITLTVVRSGRHPVIYIGYGTDGDFCSVRNVAYIEDKEVWSIVRTMRRGVSLRQAIRAMKNERKQCEPFFEKTEEKTLLGKYTLRKAGLLK